ncbi:MAG: hypothetical protein ABMB14_32675, partial [Myxococcota bacterium]
MNRDPGRPLGPADLERLDAALAPTDADVERHVRVALARSSGPVRRVPIRVIAGLAAVGFDEAGSADHYERTVEPEEWIADLLRRE